MSVGNSVGNARWTQGEEGDNALEIRMPIVLPSSVRPRDLTVEIKDLTVLCVRHKDTPILQWRLYEPVGAEVEWRVEDEGTLIMDMTKRSGSVWPCLLDLPMRPDDALFMQREELDRLFAEHYPSLPPLDDAAKEPAAKDAANGAENGDEEDLDKLLDEAAEEVVGPAEKDADAAVGDGAREFLEAELENYRSEAEEIQKKLLEVMTKLETATDGDAAKEAESQKGVLEEMLRLHNTIREKRTRPSTLEHFLEVTQLDILKGRINIGAMTEEESEPFANDEERELSAEQLMVMGLGHLEQQEIQAALHFLRLAAIHHDHEQSTIILYSIYTQLGSPRGPFLLLKRALKDDSLSASANLKIGEHLDTGARHFLPMFPAALYFYQRAAQAGSVHAMLAIAQLYLRGCTSTTMMSEKQMAALRSVDKYHAWLRQAADRGCGSAYFVQACMYLKGEHGCAKSYKMAKELLEKCTTAQPDIARRAPHIYVMLEKLRQESDGAEKASEPATALSAPAAKALNGARATNGDDKVQVSSSLERLNNLSASKGPSKGPNGMLHGKKAMHRAGGAKAFWERAVTTGISIYSLYTLAFPLRIMLLPHFYTVISQFVDRIPWLSASPPPLQF